MSKRNIETYPDYDWDKIPTGSTFKALIQGTSVEGRIYNDGKKLFLCQDKNNGYSSPDKLGYKYSWYIEDGEPIALEEHEVQNLEVWLPEAGYKNPIHINEFGGYEVDIAKDRVTVGCTPVSFEQVEAVYKKMLALRKADKTKSLVD